MDFLRWLWRDAKETWNEGFDVFVQSPYGIGIGFLILFWWLSTKRRRM